METISVSISNAALFAGRRSSPPSSLPQKPPLRRTPTVSAFKTRSRTVREIVEDDVLEMFLKDRETNGDFISKASDRIWLREFLESVDDDADEISENVELAEQATQHDSEKRKKLNLLKYEALKRELMLLSISIGAACSGYCLIALSMQAAVSYAVGVLFSCLYLQLLYRYSDNVSKVMVPGIFMQKNSKKIGIRSEDLKNFSERTIKGSGLALSSPRLVIPAAIYGFWALSHKFFQNDLFDFEIVPAMVGMFVYKAAALVQVYRDNKDLQFIFPDNEGDQSG